MRAELICCSNEKNHKLLAKEQSEERKIVNEMTYYIQFLEFADMINFWRENTLIYH